MFLLFQHTNTQTKTHRNTQTHTQTHISTFKAHQHNYKKISKLKFISKEVIHSKEGTIWEIFQPRSFISAPRGPLAK